jgi:hypothetical protein
MKSVGKIVKVTRLDKAIMEMVVDDVVTQRLVEKRRAFLAARRRETMTDHKIGTREEWLAARLLGDLLSYPLL